MTIRTLLVDDAQDVRALLRIALRARGGFEVVGEAATGTEAAELAGRLRPDVVVLDLELPDLSPRGLLAEVRRQSPDSRIVIFSGSDADRSWFEQQSATYVLKSSDLDDLVGALTEAGAAAETPDQAVLELPHDVVAAREARSVVRELLQSWGYGALVDDAVLVVSELVTNAVEHAASAVAVVVNRSGDGVRIEVRDEGSGVPQERRASESAEAGRGLMIVSALASAWGVDAGPPSKTVWVELSP